MKQEQASLLVVDDNKVNCDLLCRWLGHSYAITTADGGKQALELIESQPFDLVLLDIVMPDVTGIDVLMKVRQHHSPSELPIIMVSVKNDSKDIVDAFKLGANDYVTRPIIEEEFIARISNLIINKHLFDQVREQKEELRAMAMTDQLTGVYNKTLFVRNGCKIYQYCLPAMQAIKSHPA